MYKYLVIGFGHQKRNDWKEKSRQDSRKNKDDMNKQRISYKLK